MEVTSNAVAGIDPMRQPSLDQGLFQETVRIFALWVDTGIEPNFFAGSLASLVVGPVLVQVVELGQAVATLKATPMRPPCVPHASLMRLQGSNKATKRQQSHPGRMQKAE